jgi:outer membrane protein assembly factor BamD (BamD/ComL family)
MKILILYLFFTCLLFAQTDVDIVEYLRQIEEGKSEEVKKELAELKKKNPDAPSVIYLEALMTEDGESALRIYSRITEKYPRSKYADAALFRQYSYYEAVNSGQAVNYADRLRNEFPSSPYTKLLPSVVNKPASDKEEIYYTIQTGAFTNSANAESLRKKFENAGYHTLVQDKMTGGTLFKIVYAGKFKTVKEAEDFQVILNRKYGIKGLITRLP